jgi:hypothetical protein
MNIAKWSDKITALCIVFASSLCAREEEAICQDAAIVLRCFHPTGVYVSCDRTAPDRAKIYFNGALTRRPYHIEVLSESRDIGFSRLKLLEDTALIPGRRHCPLTEWHLRIPTVNDPKDDP